MEKERLIPICQNLVEVSSLTSYAIAWLNALSSISKMKLRLLPIACISLFLIVIPCLVS